MGMGNIVGDRELANGAYHASPDQGADVLASISRTGEEAGRAALGQYQKAVDGLGRGVRDAADDLARIGARIREIEYTDPINRAEQEIKDYELKVRTAGYLDEQGVKRPGVELLRGKEASAAAETWDHAVQLQAHKIAAHYQLDDRQIEELRRRTHGLRIQTFAKLSEWGAAQALGAMVVDGKVRLGKDLQRIVDQHVSDIDISEDELGAIGEMGVTSDEITSIRNVAIGAGAEKLVSDLIERRDKFVVEMQDRSLGRMSYEAAQAYADDQLKKSGWALVKTLAEQGQYDRANALLDRGDRVGISAEEVESGREEVEKIKYLNLQKAGREVKRLYDNAEREAYKTDMPLEEYSRMLAGWASDTNLQSTDPDRAQRYARSALAIENALKVQAKFARLRQEKEARGESISPDDYNASFDPEVYRRISDPKYVEDKVYRALDLIRLAKCDKENSQAVARAQFEAFQTLAEVEAYQLMDRGKIAALRKEIDPVMNEQAVNAMRIWYSRWGVSPQFVTKGGSVRESDVSSQPDELTLSRRNDYESDAPQARMDKRKFFELSSELLYHLQNAPDKYNDVAAMHALLDRLEIDGLESMQDDTIDTTQEVLSVLNTVERGVQDAEFYENLSRDTSDLKEAPVPKRVKKPQEEKAEKAPENRQSLRPRPPSFMPKEKPQPKKEYRYRPKPPTGW